MEIKTITIPFMFNISVNCYLVKAGDGYILIDTGTSQKRSIVEGSDEWDVLYRKYYEEELARHRKVMP